ncbi:hypothetical protein ACIBL3_23430 [Kribbella sp. NPDC050124]|uniref:hypothetical protein n=1 Tax=Kribbella sp. NPDC050124 TaxID=3364114 RepID=UPI0037A1F5EF
MAVMGERSPAEWTEEFERTGRVVFPVRRRPVLIQFALFLLLISGSQINSLTEIDSASGIDLIFHLIGFASVAGLVSMAAWQLITQRPMVIVDREGVRYGKKRFMPWADIGTIGLATGPKFFMAVPVLPANVWDKDLRLNQYNVKDVPALAAWLTTVLKQYRANGRTFDEQPAAD